MPKASPKISPKRTAADALPGDLSKERLEAIT